MTRKPICLVAILLTAVVSQAQIDQQLDKLRTVVPPSPNASSLAKYGEWPVSLYTGLPDISIPIYELKARELTVPITLSYHAAGVRVGEIASWVGLGWSLSAGGAITRSVKGLPDEEGYFAAAANYSNPDNFCSVSNDPTYSTQHRVSVAKGDGDAQLDLYNFSALGKSYRLLLKADGTVLTMPYSNIRITVTTVNVYKLWTVIMEDGTKLLFGGADNFVETNTSTQFQNPFVSTWYLKSITSTSGETINFSYSLNGQLNEHSHSSEQDVIKYSSYYGGNDVVEFDKSRSNAQQYITSYNLRSIESSLTKVEFIASASNREDLKNAASLSEIKVYFKPTNNCVVDYVFAYDYSTCAPGNENLSGVAPNDVSYLHKRLKLQSLSRVAVPDNIGVQKWSFEYNPQSLPSRRSYAQDHWGFFNGAVSNTTLLPPVYFAIPSYLSAYYSTGFMPGNHPLGADKEANETYMQAEVLTKITYPTGGYTQFEYEGNGYASVKEFFGDQTVPLSLNLTSTTTPYVTERNYPFTITKPQYIALDFSSYISPEIFNDFINARCNAQIINSSGETLVGFTNNGSKWFNLPVAGNYTLRIATNVTQDKQSAGTAVTAEAQLRYFPSLGSLDYKKLVGGLRVKKIKDFDGANTVGVNAKYFVYEEPLEINPITELDYLTETDEDKCRDQGGAGPFPYHKVVRNASTKYSLGNIAGGTIGYGKVTVLYGLNGSNGKSVSIFSNEPDQGVDLAKVYPYPSTDSREWRRGLLLQKSDYTASTVKIKEEINTYGFVYKYGVTNFTAGYIYRWCPTLCTHSLQYCGVGYACYNISTEQVKPLSKTEVAYQPDGTNPLTTTTNYFYDNPNNLQATRTETTNSKAETIRIIARTPLEKDAINATSPLSPVASAAIDVMLQRNILTPVIQTEKWKVSGSGSNLLSRSLVNYKQWSTDIVSPENVAVQQLSNPLETRVRFTLYDLQGNLLEQQKENDVKQAFLYGYDKNFPVAQVVGADYATISGFVDQTVLDNPNSTEQQIKDELDKLRAGLINTKAAVTTYIYKPFVGVSSLTDANGRVTHYEYDGFGRLMHIRDHNGNILKKYCYNFAGQPEACTASVQPQWQATGNYQCVLNSYGQNTGYREREEIDLNPGSPSYNTTRWLDDGYNPAACSPPAVCDWNNCNQQGEGYACINGQCELGYKVYTASYYDWNTGMYECVYHYEYSDGSWSVTYYESSYWPCQ